MGSVRIPFPLKVMLSYLVVVGLVFIPTLFHLDNSIERELRGTWIEQLRRQSQPIAEYLANASPQDLPKVIKLLVSTASERLTIMRADGTVIADSEVSLDRLDNHAERAEVIEALEKGNGVSERKSTSTGEDRIYVAQRFPPMGHAVGVVRVSVPASKVAHGVERSRSFLRLWAAIAISISAILTLAAALVFSRPLKEISRALRGLAQGDFGYRLEVRSNDEIGEAAEAFRDLIQQLRPTLVDAGAARASLESLLSAVPSGILLYDKALNPIATNGAARILADLTPDNEEERTRMLADCVPSPDFEGVVLEKLPWSNREVEVRAFQTAAVDGGSTLGLILIDRDLEGEHEELSGHLRGTVLLLREAARQLPEELGTRLEVEADGLERMSSIETIPAPPIGALLSELCATAFRQVMARMYLRKVKLKVDLPEGAYSVAENDGVALRAIRSAFEFAIRHAKKGSSIVVDAELVAGFAVLSCRFKGRPDEFDELDPAARTLGIERTFTTSEDYTTVRLSLPRA